MSKSEQINLTVATSNVAAILCYLSIKIKYLHLFFHQIVFSQIIIAHSDACFIKNHQ